MVAGCNHRTGLHGSVWWGWTLGMKKLCTHLSLQGVAQRLKRNPDLTEVSVKKER